MSGKASLVVMAAGMGSRYGGLKQIDPVDEYGHVLVDFAAYDAIAAGFDRIVFVVKPETEADMRGVAGRRIGRHCEVCYAHQTLDALPPGFSVPEGRRKPWGTAHAVMCASKFVDGPFAAINADDYYGPEAYRLVFEHITGGGAGEHCMVGYLLRNTLTDNGCVSRGVCTVDGEGYLLDVEEYLKIEKCGGDAVYTTGTGERLPVSGDTVVSLNMWGFANDMMAEIERGFSGFLSSALGRDALKCEYFLPSAAKNVISSGRGRVKVLKTHDRWFGVTYREDKAAVAGALAALKKQGVYPDGLWEK